MTDARHTIAELEATLARVQDAVSSLDALDVASAGLELPLTPDLQTACEQLSEVSDRAERASGLPHPMPFALKG